MLLRRICNKPLCAQKHKTVCRCRFMRQGAYASTVVCDITLLLFAICRYHCCPYHTFVVCHTTMLLLPIQRCRCCPYAVVVVAHMPIALNRAIVNNCNETRETCPRRGISHAGRRFVKGGKGHGLRDRQPLPSAAPCSPGLGGQNLNWPSCQNLQPLG